jgi:hypothetical protein
MVNRSLLIGKVSPFLGKKEIVVANQDTVDIIDALIKNHYKYSNEYDKIFRFFDGGSVEETAFNVWCFLKDEFKYNIEPEEMQILRSPGALLASNIVGIDCKGYATFANGVMDAYRRNTGKNFDVYYRFASYDPFDNTPQHVFAVVKENGNEFWIDPVLDQFDEKKQPYFYKDKKIKNMALVAMSGIQDNSNNNDQIGAFGDPTTDNRNWWEVLVSGAPAIITATRGGSSQGFNAGGGTFYDNPMSTPSNLETVQPQSTGISTSTILLIGAAGLAAYFLLKKK